MSYNIRYYRKTKLNASNIIFSYFYRVNKIWMRYFLVIFASIITAIIFWLFFQFSGLYSAGLSSFSQGFSRLTQVLIIKNNSSEAGIQLAKNISNVIFWVSFIVMNIPLAIFSFFKLGRHFTLMSVSGFLIGDLVGLGLGFIPEVQNLVHIFGDSNSTYGLFEKNGVQILMWSNQKDLVRIIPLFFYAIVGALLLPFFYSLIYILGASTGGTDFISYYFSVKKHRALGTLITIFNSTSLFVGTIIGSYISASIISPEKGEMIDGHLFTHQQWSIQFLLSPNFLASMMGSILMGFIVNIIFPKSKMVQIKIYSKKCYQICDYLIANNYPHTFTITQSTGAYSKKPTWTAESICQFIETPSILKQINEIDDQSLIHVTVLNKVQGMMNVLEKID